MIQPGSILHARPSSLADAFFFSVQTMATIEKKINGLGLAIASIAKGAAMKIVGSNGYEETAGSQICVMTAGLARKPGMSRDDCERVAGGSNVVAST